MLNAFVSLLVTNYYCRLFEILSKNLQGYFFITAFLVKNSAVCFSDTVHPTNNDHI